RGQNPRHCGLISRSPSPEPTPSLGSDDPPASPRRGRMALDGAPRRAEGVSSMRYRSLAVAASLTILIARSARAEFPFLADVNRGELPAPMCATPPSGPDPRDCSCDGVFNAPDYDTDPRVSDRNGNGVIDPEDLIMTFSDGVDDDGDGYIDNIAGWDFFESDNDPFDEVQFGHGTGEAEDSTAEANNGGALGTCPNCMVMPVRVGDSFVAEVDRFAQGVVFAVDTGAAVVQEALGTLNNSAFGQQAIDYAYSHNVPVMASAADEDAWHHNYPSNYVHAIVVNSIRDFGVQGVEPASWLYIDGCTNFGGNISVSVSSTSCSSEATGRSSGIAGMIVSAGRDAVAAGTLSRPLTANEVRQLFEQTADDLNFEMQRQIAFPDTIRYASEAGADQFTGHG